MTCTISALLSVRTWPRQRARLTRPRRAGILDIYRQKVVNPTTGAIEPVAHDAFMRDYGRTLTSYKSAGVNALDEIKNVGQQAAAVGESISKLNSLAKSMKFDTVDELA